MSENANKCRYNEKEELEPCPAMRRSFGETSARFDAPSTWCFTGDNKHWCLGIRFRNTVDDCGVILNYCPWCGAEVLSPEVLRRNPDLAEQYASRRSREVTHA